MPKASAGILAYRRGEQGLEFLLAHPGGPFWARRDVGAWSIPKGEFESEESPFDAALREFAEETGFTPRPPYVELGTIRQPSGKEISAWAMESDADAALATSNHFEMEWPPHSGKLSSFPEMDRAEWFGYDEARVKIIPGQVGFLDRALLLLGGDSESESGADD